MLLFPDRAAAHHGDRVEQGVQRAVQCRRGRKPSYCLTYVSLGHGVLGEALCSCPLLQEPHKDSKLVLDIE